MTNQRPKTRLATLLTILLISFLLLGCNTTEQPPETFSLPADTSDTDGLKLYVKWAAAKQGQKPSQMSDTELNELLTSYLVWRKNEALRRQDQMTEDLIAGAREESNMK